MRDYGTLFLMVALTLGILAFWGLMKAKRKIRRDDLPVAAESDEPTRGDPSEEHWVEVMELRERDRQKESAAGGQPSAGTERATENTEDTEEEPPAAAETAEPGGAAGTAGSGTAGAAGGDGKPIKPWEPLGGDEISNREYDDLIRKPERRAEAERAKFLPPLEEFKPLEPVAVRDFRIRATEWVTARKRPSLSLPSGGSGRLEVVDATSDALTAKGPAGGKRTIRWEELPVESLYGLARVVAKSDTPDVQARDLVRLAQLAGLAGLEGEAKSLRMRAARLHFRRALAERGERARPRFTVGGAAYTAVGGGSEGLVGRGADGTGRTFPWEEVTDGMLYEVGLGLVGSGAPAERVRDELHLSRLAGEAGRVSDAARHASEVIRIDPAFRDELEGRAQVLPNLYTLDDVSWSVDPKDPRSADADAAQDLAADAPSIYNLYRFMRTLGEDRLNSIAIPNPPSPRLFNYPKENRGRVFRIHGGFIRRYKSIRFTKRPEHVEAGIRDLTFCFVSDTEVMGGLYIVSVPHEVKGYDSSDLVSVTGVYLRRWPYRRHGRWRWIPWIVAMKMKKLEVKPTRGWGGFLYALLAAGCAGGVILYFAARKESKQATAARDHLHERRLAGRRRVRRKVADAVKAATAAEASAETGGADDTKPDETTERATENTEDTEGEGRSHK